MGMKTDVEMKAAPGAARSRELDSQIKMHVITLSPDHAFPGQHHLHIPHGR
jgi:hypothetical protein